MARESGGGAVNDVSELDYNTQPWRLDIEKFRLPRESHDHPRHDRVSSTSLNRLLPASSTHYFPDPLLFFYLLHLNERRAFENFEEHEMM